MTLTPEQFNKLATLDDLNQLREELFTKMATSEHINILLGAIDGLTKKVVDFQDELASN